MRTYSNAFKELYNRGEAVFYQTGKLVLTDGTVIELGRSDFYMDGNDFSEGAQQNAFPLGVAISKSVNVLLVNDDDRYSQYDFYLAHLQLWCCCDVGDKVEKWYIGEYVITTPETYGDAVAIAAVDYMYRADTPYAGNIETPTTLGNILKECCDALRIQLKTPRFQNYNFVVNEIPEGDYTYRDLIGYVAQLASGCARLDENNQLEIITWDYHNFESVLNGGVFDILDTPYKSGSRADGGTFAYDDGDDYDGGDFKTNDIHNFYRQATPTVDTDDVIITGVITEVDDTVYQSGKEGYMMAIDNPLIYDKPQAGVDLIASTLVGVHFRVFDISHIAYPFVNFGDRCYVSDRRGNAYQSVVTDFTFTYFGNTAIKCAAESPLRNSSLYNSEAAKAVIAAKKDMWKELTARDAMIEHMNKLVANSMGLYSTFVENDEGATIFYWHNKPELENSQIIWRMAAEVFSVSTDGGKTWNYSMDATGNVLANVLNVIGVSADWINAGSITMGGESLNVDGEIIMRNAAGETIFKLNKEGILFKDGVITWSSIAGANAAVTKITRDTVNAPYVNSLGISCEYLKGKYLTGKVIATGDRGAMLWASEDSKNIVCTSLETNTDYGSSGAIQANGQLGATGDCIIGGTVYCADIQKTSDERKKMNIKPLSENYLKLFEILEPKTYQLVSNSEPQIGFVAQEVQKAFSECKIDDVGTVGELNDYFTLSYDNFIGILWQGLQDARKRIEELEKIIKEGE